VEDPRAEHPKGWSITRNEHPKGWNIPRAQLPKGRGIPRAEHPESGTSEGWNFPREVYPKHPTSRTCEERNIPRVEHPTGGISHGWNIARLEHRTGGTSHGWNTPNGEVARTDTERLEVKGTVSAVSIERSEARSPERRNLWTSARKGEDPSNGSTPVVKAPSCHTVGAPCRASDMLVRAGVQMLRRCECCGGASGGASDDASGGASRDR
jgi:hypothetical protein